MKLFCIEASALSRTDPPQGFLEAVSKEVARRLGSAEAGDRQWSRQAPSLTLISQNCHAQCCPDYCLLAHPTLSALARKHSKLRTANHGLCS